MFTTISLLTPFAAWVNVSSMIYCTGKTEGHRSTAEGPRGLKQPDGGWGTDQTRLKHIQVTERGRNGCGRVLPRLEKPRSVSYK